MISEHSLSNLARVREDFSEIGVAYDEDHDRIAAITGQEHRWLAPRGTLG